MINSVSQLSTMPRYMAPRNNESVTIDGKTYPVIKVQDNNPMVKSFAPMYKEVVIIDGKQYNINNGGLADIGNLLSGLFNTCSAEKGDSTNCIA